MSDPHDQTRYLDNWFVRENKRTWKSLPSNVLKLDRKVRDDLLDRARSRLVELRAAASLANDPALWSQLRHHIVLAEGDRVNYRILLRRSAVFRITVWVGLLAAGITYVMVDIAAESHRIVVGVGGVIGFLLPSVGKMPPELAADAHRSWLLRRFRLATMLLALLLAGTVRARPNTYPGSALLGWSLGTAVFIGTIAAGTLFAWLLLLWQERVVFPPPLRARVVNHLAWALVAVKQPAYWRSARGRRHVAEAIEQAARSLERHLNREFTNLDFETDAWRREHVAEISSCVRHLKRWVVTPSPDAQHRLGDILEKITAEAVHGNWEALKVVTLEKVAAERLRTRLAALARQLAAGCLPLALVATLVALDLISGAAAVSLLAFSGTLAAISLLVAVDPQLMSRMGEIRQSFSSLHLPDVTRRSE